MNLQSVLMPVQSVLHFLLYVLKNYSYFQWAKIIMSIERSVPSGTAKEYLEKYSIRLSATERGVMVIKSKDKIRNKYEHSQSPAKQAAKRVINKKGY